MKRLLAAWVALLSHGGTGHASTIQITLGSYSFVTQPTIDGTMVFVPVRNNGTGAGAGVTNGVVQTYVLPPGATDFTPIGRVGNIVYGNLGINNNDVGATFNVATNTWVQQPNYHFFAAGSGGQFGGADATNGMPVEGTISNTGAISNVIHIPTPPGSIGETFGIFGNISTGFFDNGGFGQAFCADGGVLRGLGSGSSVGLGVNGSNGSCLGSMLVGTAMDAVSWNLSGSPSFFANVSGTGNFVGDAISGYSNFTMLENLAGTAWFINDGTRTMPLPSYCTSFGLTCNAAAYIVPDSVAGMADIFAQGSVIQLTATFTELDAPFRASSVPEPGTVLLVGMAVVLVIGYRKRRALPGNLVRKKVRPNIRFPSAP